jgi:pyruvate/2-oxoglutarate dehydrogenase complex dihydrolipoamide acyltransferase (E2) component
LDILDTAAKTGGAHIENKAPEKAAAVVKAVETAAPVASAHTHNAHNADGSKIQTTPAVRKIAKENKVDLTRVNGTGPKGRILKEDVQQYIAGGHQSPAGKATFESPVAAPAAPAFVSGVDTKVPIRGVGRLMVKSMTAANQVRPFFPLENYLEFTQISYPGASPHPI